MGDESARSLVVDLDGTLVRTDTTLMSLRLLCRRPLTLLHLLPTLLRGRAVFKARLATAAPLDARRLAYHRPLLAYLREQRGAGRHLVLATGADRRTADMVARHLALFDTVLASDGHTNLTGTAKLVAINETLGGAPFTYIGNSATDLRVWCSAAGAVCVNARPGVIRAAAKLTDVERVFPPDK